MSGELPLRVLNPTTKTAMYSHDARFNYGFMDVFDMEGRLVCSFLVLEDYKDAMQQYLSNSYGTEGRKVDETYELRQARKARADPEEHHRTKKARRDEIRWDGDSKIMARA